MKWIHHKGMSYLQFPSLAAIGGIFHAVFTRYAMNGRQQRTALNLGLGCGDPDNMIWANRRRVLDTMGSRFAVFARQVHGADVGVWSGPSDTLAQGKGSQHGHAYLQADALITAMAGPALMIQVADCQPVLMVDPVQRVAANVHSGWRGSIQNVIGRTLAAMSTQFGCRPEDIHCGIGPSLGPCCAQFVNFQKEIPEQFWSYRQSGDLFDFWQLSVDQLIAAGVPQANIAVSRICTRCNQQLFFSYRGERSTGRFAAVIGIK